MGMELFRRRRWRLNWPFVLLWQIQKYFKNTASFSFIIRTRDCRMVAGDESTELWWPNNLKILCSSCLATFHTVIHLLLLVKELHGKGRFWNVGVNLSLTLVVKLVALLVWSSNPTQADGVIWNAINTGFFAKILIPELQGLFWQSYYIYVRQSFRLSITKDRLKSELA